MALSASRLTLLEKLVSERTPLRVLQKEHGFNYKTVRKYFPDYRLRKETGDGFSHPTAREVVEEKQGIVESMLKEDAPGSAIAAAIGVSTVTLRKHYPEYFWSREKVASFGGMVRALNMMDGPYRA